MDQHHPDGSSSGRRYASVERNIERYPTFPLSKQGVQEIRWASADGSATWIVASDSKRGLPGPFANDLYVALCKLYNDAHRPEDRKVSTTFVEIAELLEIERGGNTYKAIRSTLRAMKSVTITAVRTFKEGEVKASEKIFSLIDSITFEYRRDGDRGRTGVTVRFSEELADSILSNRYYRLLDVDVYRSLSTPTAKRLYRYLDLRRWRGRESTRTLVVPLREVQERLPLADAPASDLKRILNGAHDELLRIGFLTAAEYEHHPVPRKTRAVESWSIRYELEADQVEMALEKQKLADPGISTAENEYLKEMVEEILSVLRDEHSTGFYVRVVKSLPEPVVRGILGHAKEAIRDDGLALDAARKIFTTVARKRAEVLGVTL